MTGLVGLGSVQRDIACIPAEPRLRHTVRRRLLARPEMQRREDWAGLAERFGGLRPSGDGLRNLDRGA